MKYRKTAKSMAAVLAALLAFQPATALAVTFADMNQVPWPGAETSINKAAELKLVVGEEINGKNYFKPKDPVSLSQACQLAYKLLLETGKTSANTKTVEKWTVVMNTYKIQSWAHPAVSFCLENSIIDIADLSGFVSGEVNRSATREQAAEILGRALEYGVPANKATATTTKFVDNASISAAARPYIALLNTAGIVNGDDTNRFNPKNTLNRTETAVMVTNMYSKLKNAATVAPPVAAPTTASGTVKDMNAHYVNLAGSNAYYLYSSSGVTATLNGSSSSIDALVTMFKDGSTLNASLTLDGNTRITKLAVTAEVKASSSEKLTEGKLTKAYYDDEDEDGYIIVGSTSTYRIDDVDDVDIEIDGKEYDLDELVDLLSDCKKDGTYIDVDLTLDSKDNLTKIKGSIEEDDASDKDGYAVRGKLTDVNYDEDDEEGYIELDDDDSFDWDDKTKIYIDDEKADWEDLLDLFDDAEDDEEELNAKVTMEEKGDDEVFKIEVFTEDYEGDEEDSLSKTVVEKVTYDKEDGEGSITLNGKKYKTEDVTEVEIDIVDGDSTIEKWKDLYNAFDDNKKITVEAEVDGNEIVELKGYVSYVTGRLVDFDDDCLKIEGKDSGTDVEYNFEDPDKISMGDFTGKSFDTLEDLLEWLEKEDDDGDLDLGDEHKFTLKFNVDKDGNIDGAITGKFEKEK